MASSHVTKSWIGGERGWFEHAFIIKEKVVLQCHDTGHALWRVACSLQPTPDAVYAAHAIALRNKDKDELRQTSV